MIVTLCAAFMRSWDGGEGFLLLLFFGSGNGDGGVENGSDVGDDDVEDGCLTCVPGFCSK